MMARELSGKPDYFRTKKVPKVRLFRKKSGNLDFSYKKMSGNLDFSYRKMSGNLDFSYRKMSGNLDFFGIVREMRLLYAEKNPESWTF